jgi:hypothetical protein
VRDLTVLMIKLHERPRVRGAAGVVPACILDDATLASLQCAVDGVGSLARDKQMLTPRSAIMNHYLIICHQ